MNFYNNGVIGKVNMKDSDTSGKKEYSVAEIISKAKIGDNPDIYANHAQIMVTNAEIIIDLFKISPDPAKQTTMKISAEMVQRILLPHSLGKGLVDALANSIANFQIENNIEFQNNRKPDVNDKIKVW